jgi:asparagine synthase (glutamine-hydrolysing)
MCGILGALPATSPDLFERALTAISHRGPDGYGIWSDEGRIMLGHRRLSILDKSSAGSQPMHRAGRYHIVFNGEIYNFLELRRDLEAEGNKFTSQTDTEVLLAAFMRWKENCLARLNGMWALAIWDSQQQELFLARDRMGEKPLFYTIIGGRLIFASEQKALLPFMKQIEASDNFHILCRNPYAYEGTSESLFKGILRFPAAHFAWYRDGKMSIQKFWSPLENIPEIPVEYEEQVEALRELLLDSCKIRLRSDVPVATGLSGGIDSSAIAACVAEVGKRGSVDRLPSDWQNAFVASFPGSIMDEAAAAKQIATHLGIRLHQVPIVDDKINPVDLEKIAYLFEEVHEVNPLPHFYLYQEMRNQGILVSLDGHGGDELFCGYESSVLHALPSTLFAPKDFQMVLGVYKDIHPHNLQFEPMNPLRAGAYLVRSEVKNILRWWNRDNPMRAATSKSDSLNRHLLGLSFETTLPTLLRNYDHYSMMSGVEIRIPLLDHRIIDFAFAINWKSKLRKGYTKSILRDAVSQWLPDSVIKNKIKIGFAPPIIDWIRGPLKEYILDEVSSSDFNEANLINPKKLKNDFYNLINSGENHNLYRAEKVWKNYSIYLWEKIFINGNRV